MICSSRFFLTFFLDTVLLKLAYSCDFRSDDMLTATWPDVKGSHTSFKFCKKVTGKITDCLATSDLPGSLLKEEYYNNEANFQQSSSQKNSSKYSSFSCHVVASAKVISAQCDDAWRRSSLVLIIPSHDRAPRRACTWCIRRSRRSVAPRCWAAICPSHYATCNMYCRASWYPGRRACPLDLASLPLGPALTNEMAQERGAFKRHAILSCMPLAALRAVL